MDQMSKKVDVSSTFIEKNISILVDPRQFLRFSKHWLMKQVHNGRES